MACPWAARILSLVSRPASEGVQVIFEAGSPLAAWTSDISDLGLLTMTFCQSRISKLQNEAVMLLKIRIVTKNRSQKSCIFKGLLLSGIEDWHTLRTQPVRQRTAPWHKPSSESSLYRPSCKAGQVGRLSPAPRIANTQEQQGPAANRSEQSYTANLHHPPWAISIRPGSAPSRFFRGGRRIP